VPDNPTGALATWLGQRVPARSSAVEVIATVLPVEWVRAPAILMDLLQRHDPDVSLHFGASRRAKGFRIEQWARNRISPNADAAGRKAVAPEILAGAPRALRAPLPAARLALRLQGLGLPCVASADAGRYLCNAVYSLALERMRREGRPRLCQFVHVPAVIGADERADGLSWPGLRKGAMALIEDLAAAARRSAHRPEMPEHRKGIEP
jgi:pyroglutamyl-peptidase